MDVGSIILGRPWLFDTDVIIYGKSNTCIFVYEGKKVEDDKGEVEGEYILEGDCSDDDSHDHLNIIQGQLGESSHGHHLSVARCTMSLLQQADDWRRTVIL